MSDAAPFREVRQASAAVGLRLAGASYADIADALGYSSTQLARQAVEGELANRSLNPAEREALRTEEGARLERLLRGVWAKSTNPEHPEHLPAAKVALAIIDRHIRLFGLDAPAEVVVHSPTLAEIDAWVAQMTASTTVNLEAMEADVAALPALPPAS